MRADIARDMVAPEPGGAGYRAMLDRARALVPTLRTRAPRGEEMRSLPPETVADLHAAGLFRIVQPRRIGGCEFDYVALVDFAAELARGDASVGWNLGNLASHHWMLGMFAPAAQEAVWGADPDALIASSFVFPAGRATRTEGGYRLAGRWPFSSGVGPSAWNMLAGTVAPDAELRVFLVHRDAYRIVETWDSAGLRGTGSHDVELNDLFVPEPMTVAVSALAGGPTPGSALNPGTLFKLPVFALFPFVLSGAALGNAQACVEDFEAATRKRASTYSGAQLANLQSIQMRIGAAAARVDAARRIMRSICVEAMADAAAGRIPDLGTKTAYRRDGAYAVSLCTEAVSLLFQASGAGGLARASALQRQFRDAHAIAAHIAFSLDAATANYGRVALGLSSENPTL
jgi:3-hydroxy-9,10-secoandrosta-1,3,5(10)-triene-9,17-dione monooxygenase